MRVLVTGGAGFIGSNLVDRLVSENEVFVADNLSSGKRELVNSKANFIKIDLLKDEIHEQFSRKDIIFHLAANPDVRLGAEDTKVHLEQNMLVTHRILEEARIVQIEKLVFTSTSTIYGEATTPTREEYGPLRPTSLYGASKLACEALISAYSHTFDIDTWIFRFANVIGRRSNHGVIYDFIKKLLTNPRQLEILGDGNQTKSYVYIDDCISAMFCGLKMKEKVSIFNIGSEDQISVKEVAEIVCQEMGLTPEFSFTGGRVGWRGDVPVMQLSIEKIKSLGWKPQYSSREAVRKTVNDMLTEIQ